MANNVGWANARELPSRSWPCGHCGNQVGGSRGYVSTVPNWLIYACPACGRPTFFEDLKQMPGVAFGESVSHVPKGINDLYQEARNCMANNACTSAVLACRKILMHIAVDKGAPEDKTFAFYVGFLVDGNILPMMYRTWVDAIRSKSNEANHQIVLMTRKDAEDLISFTSMLLKLLYEYPVRAT